MMTEQKGFIILEKNKKLNIDYGMITILAIATLGSAFIIGQSLIEKPVWFWLVFGAVLGIIIPNIVNDKFQKCVNVVLIIGTVLLITLWRGLFRSGFLQMVNYGIASYNYQYGREVYYYKLPDGINEELALIAFSTVVIFLIGCTFYYLVSENKIEWFILAILCMVVFVLFLRCKSAYVPSCMCVMAIPGAIMWSGSEKYGEKRLTIFLIAFLAIGLAASVTYMAFFDYKVSPIASDMRNAVTNKIDTVRYGEEDAPNGSLAKASDYEAKKETRLIIGVNATGRYYLKGFVGGEYSAEQWSEISPKKYSISNEGMFQWMKDKNFFPLAQNSQYLKMVNDKNDNKGNTCEIVVSNKNANKKYLYTPYGMNESDVKNMTGINRDMNVFQTDEKQNIMQYTIEYYDISQALNLENTEWMKDSQDEIINDFGQAQNEYRNFVYENYLDIDNDVKEFLDEHPQGVSASGYIEITNAIRKWLANSKTADVPEKEMKSDYLLQFMGTFRQGNSSFYTSAAVMMFRYCGIPARYAEGYLVGIDKSDITDAGSSQKIMLKDGNEAPYCKKITGENVHAWVEIYKDGIGWIPIEVTPGFYDNLNKKQQQQNISDSPAERVKKKEQKQPQRSNRKPVEKINILLILLCMIGIMFLMAVLFVIVIVVRRKWIIHRRKEVLNGKDYVAAMNVILPFLAKVFIFGNISEDSISEEEREVILRYRFRDGKITEDDYKKIYCYAVKMQNEIYRQLSKSEKIKFKYIKVLN